MNQIENLLFQTSNKEFNGYDLPLINDENARIELSNIIKSLNRHFVKIFEEYSQLVQIINNHKYKSTFSGEVKSTFFCEKFIDYCKRPYELCGKYKAYFKLFLSKIFNLVTNEVSYVTPFNENVQIEKKSKTLCCITENSIINFIKNNINNTNIIFDAKITNLIKHLGIDKNLNIVLLIYEFIGEIDIEITTCYLENVKWINLFGNNPNKKSIGNFLNFANSQQFINALNNTNIRNLSIHGNLDLFLETEEFENFHIRTSNSSFKIRCFLYNREKKEKEKEKQLITQKYTNEKEYDCVIDDVEKFIHGLCKNIHEIHEKFIEICARKILYTKTVKIAGYVLDYSELKLEPIIIEFESIGYEDGQLSIIPKNREKLKISAKFFIPEISEVSDVTKNNYTTINTISNGMFADETTNIENVNRQYMVFQRVIDLESEKKTKIKKISCVKDYLQENILDYMKNKMNETIKDANNKKFIDEFIKKNGFSSNALYSFQSVQSFAPKEGGSAGLPALPTINKN